MVPDACGSIKTGLFSGNSVAAELFYFPLHHLSANKQLHRRGRRVVLLHLTLFPDGAAAKVTHPSVMETKARQ